MRKASPPAAFRDFQEAQPNAKPALPAITENALAETSEIADAPDLKPLGTNGCWPKMGG